MKSFSLSPLRRNTLHQSQVMLSEACVNSWVMACLDILWRLRYAELGGRIAQGTQQLRGVTIKFTDSFHYVMLAILGELTAASQWLFIFHKFIWLFFRFLNFGLSILFIFLKSVVTTETDRDFENKESRCNSLSKRGKVTHKLWRLWDLF